ncbi:MAG: hypothetical protein HY820_16165 [Acidobacteria bacterium]|nr:hypothetical protein [Acidobacteriota bacterium]
MMNSRTPMNPECSYTLVLNQPYEQARGRIRAMLEKQGLQIAFDFDLAGGILRTAGVRLPKCSVLGVDCPYELLEAFVADGAAGVFFPLHVVLSEHGPETQARILAPQALRTAGVSAAISIPVHRTLRRVGEALTSVGAHSAKRAQEGTPVPKSPVFDVCPQEVTKK